MPIIKTNDVDFYYELHGSGRPLVLISGYASDHTFWLPVLDKLSKHYQVLVFDNRGVGQTKDDGCLLTAKLMADDVMAICNQLGIQKPHIAGQSMGGTIAQTVAAYYPDQIAKLVILNSAAKWRKAMLLACNSLLQMRKDNVDLNIIFEAMLSWIYGEEFLRSQKNVELVRQATINNPNLQSIEDQARQYGVLSQFDGLKHLEQIKTETLIVYGLQDVISLPRESAFMADQIRRSTLVELDCAHGMVAEVPRQLSEVMLTFFNK